MLLISVLSVKDGSTTDLKVVHGNIIHIPFNIPIDTMHEVRMLKCLHNDTKGSELYANHFSPIYTTKDKVDRRQIRTNNMIIMFKPA